MPVRHNRRASGLPVVSAQKEIGKHREMLERGLESLERENIDGKMRTFICDPRGRRTAVMSPKFNSALDDFFEKHGGRDGLLPGCDQTAAANHPGLKQEEER